MNNKKNKKTIIYIAPTPPPYMGPSIATQIILGSRFIDEFNVIHIDTADRRPLSRLAKIDITNFYLAFKHYLILLRRLACSHADLVYVPISQTAIGFLRDIPFIILAKLFRKKVVLHLRGGHFREFYDSSNGFVKLLIRKVLNFADRMIVLGNSLKILFDGLIPEEKLSVVPNGLNIGLDKIRKKNPQKDNLLILFLSNLIETKGFKDVLYSVKKVTRNHTNVKYIFVGSWRNDKDRFECSDYIKREKIEDYVEFKGSVTGSNKTRLLRDADIFAFPTYYPMEGHPWVIVEAMASSLPIITTDQGCIKESVIDGENGFVISKRNPDLIAEKIIYFVENSAARERMGQKSRELYEANFTEEHFVQRMIDVINLTLDNR
jgi:glycosyltransferase involved in cell wall biosynthesis